MIEVSHAFGHSMNSPKQIVLKVRLEGMATFGTFFFVLCPSLLFQFLFLSGLLNTTIGELGLNFVLIPYAG